MVNPMSRLLFVLLAPLIVMVWSGTRASAQADATDAVAFCSQNPDYPTCRAIMEQFCAMNPDQAACMSDDEDDDS